VQVAARAPDLKVGWHLQTYSLISSGMFINDAEGLIIIGGRRRRRQGALLLKFSFPTSLLHVGKGAVRKRATESLALLAIEIRIKRL
jgi:hypothetical protein